MFSSHDLFVGVVLAPMLVTTLVSRRHAMLWVWSQRKTHCSDKPRAESIQRCAPHPLLHPALLRPPHQKETRVFSMASRSVTPCFLDLASCFVTNVFWKTPPEHLDLGPMTKDQRKHHSNHHRNLNRHHHHHRDHIIHTMYSSTPRCWWPVAYG